MGSTWSTMTLDEFLREDFTGHDILARGAGMSDFDRRVTWLATKRKDNGSVGAVEVLWSRYDGGTCVKYVSEDMGPGDAIIPDNVWKAIKDTPPLNDYSAKWRDSVREYRDQYPLRVEDLNLLDYHNRFAIGTEHGEVEVTYLGRVGTSQTFESADSDRFRYRMNEQRILRCRPI